MFLRPSLYLLLDGVKLSQRDDCFVGIFYVVHRQLSVILPPLLRKVVIGEGLLQQQIPGICIVPQDTHETCLTPGIAVSADPAFLVQHLDDGHKPHTLQITFKNKADSFHFLRLDNVCAVIVAVAEDRAIPYEAVFVIVAYTPFLILADGSAFFLGIGC